VPSVPRPPLTRGDDKRVPAGRRNRDAPGMGSIPESGRQAAEPPPPLPAAQTSGRSPFPTAPLHTQHFPSTKTTPATESLPDPPSPCLLCSNQHGLLSPTTARLLTESTTRSACLCQPGAGKSSCSLPQPRYSGSEPGSSQPRAGGTRCSLSQSERQTNSSRLTSHHPHVPGSLIQPD